MNTYEKALSESIKYFNGDELAAKVFVDKYALRNSDGEIVEMTPEDMHNRIAKELARIENKKYGKEKAFTKKQIFDFLDRFRYIVPQGSPMFGIGNPKHITLSNCYVIDPPEDSYSGILWTDEQLVQISKRRGGVGTDLSNLRPSGSPTHNSSNTSTGVVSFANRYSNSIREVGQSGRRGALLLSLSIHHPDVLEFATCKKDLTKVTGANISVRISDEFMNAVINDETYEQRWPVDSNIPEISREVPARDVWNVIVENAHAHAEPGLLFWDRIITESPADCYASDGFKTVSTNPCVTADTWIYTQLGPKQVKDLVGCSFTAIVNGVAYNALPMGFWATGIKDVYRVTTQRGYSFTCTQNHMLCECNKTRYHIEETWKPLSDLSIGSTIALSNHRKNNVGVSITSTDDDLKLGWLIGNLIGGGHFVDDCARLEYWGQDKEYMHSLASKFLHQYYSNRSDLGQLNIDTTDATKLGVKSKNLAVDALRFINHEKDMLKQIEYCSQDFCRGLLSGWFDADGTVHDDNEKGRYIRVSSTNLINLQIAQRMLSRMGIACAIYQNRQPDGQDCKANHDLHISNDNLQLFYELIGFKTPYKQKQLISLLNSYVRTPNREMFVDTIANIEYVGQQKVYDCYVPNINEFDGNGIRLHNCSELPLSALDSCRLLLLNCLSFVQNPFTDEAYFQWHRFHKYGQIAQRLMDDIIDLELEAIEKIIKKIEKDPEEPHLKDRELSLWRRIYKNCETGRRTGTGITALGDTIAALGIPYGSKQAIEFTDALYNTLKFACYRESINMAQEIGAFPAYNQKSEANCEFFKRFQDEVLKLSDNVIIDGNDIIEDMLKYGRRNIACLTTAPAGSVSLLTQTTSGVEPLYFMSSMRRKKGNPKDEGFRVDFTDETGDNWMEFEVFHPQVKRWMEITGEIDTKKSPWFNNCAEDLDYMLRIQIQAAAQKHVDHAISSTINLPHDINVETVSDIYINAWKYGCKGITVYRKGSRDGVILEKRVDNEEKDDTIAEKRPRVLPCEVHHTSVKGQSYFVLVGMLDGKPYEVFAGKNGFISKNVKTGTITRKRKNFYIAKFDGTDDELSPITASTNEMEEVITRLTSLSLRSGANMHLVVQQLEKVGERQELHSFARGVARILKKYIADGTPEGEKCPECSANVIRQEGCVCCKSCGWSKCL